MKTIQQTFALLMGGWPAALWAQPSAALPEDIRDVRGPVFDPAPWWEVAMPYAIGALGALALALVARAVWRRLRRPLNPMQRALARIDEARRLAREGHVARFADELSEALRAYIEERFEVHAPRQTTEELLGRLASDAGSALRQHREELATFLRICDEAKFGGYDIEADAMDALAAAAREFVTQTYDAASPDDAEPSAVASAPAPVSPSTVAGQAPANAAGATRPDQAEEAA